MLMAQTCSADSSARRSPALLSSYSSLWDASIHATKLGVRELPAKQSAKPLAISDRARRGDSAELVFR
jgi:hypothetical protein